MGQWWLYVDFTHQSPVFKMLKHDSYRYFVSMCQRLASSLIREPAEICTWLPENWGEELYITCQERHAVMFAKFAGRLVSKTVNLLQGSKTIIFMMIFSARQKLFLSLLDKSNLQINP